MWIVNGTEVVEAAAIKELLKKNFFEGMTYHHGGFCEDGRPSSPLLDSCDVRDAWAGVCFDLKALLEPSEKSL